MAKEVFRLGELFCGPGGLAHGAMTAMNDRFQIVHQWANDYDASTCDTYRRNICPEDPDSVVCGDVRTLDIEPLGEIDAFAFEFHNSYSFSFPVSVWRTAPGVR